MPDVTINDLAEVTTIASGDFVAIWRTANADTRKISRTNFFGATLTGGGTIATGGYTLTVPATGTAVLLTASQTLTNKTLTTPTISATGFTNAQHAHTGATSGGQLTTAALSNLSTLLQTTGAQTATGVKTFSDGIAFAHETLNYYDEGTWTPAVTFGGGSTGITYSNRLGRYTRIGRTVFIECVINMSNKGSSTGELKIGGLPFTVITSSIGTGYFTCRWANFATSYYSILVTPNSATTDIVLRAETAATGTYGSAIQDTDTNNNSNLLFSLFYTAA